MRLPGGYTPDKPKGIDDESDLPGPGSDGDLRLPPMRVKVNGNAHPMIKRDRRNLLFWKCSALILALIIWAQYIVSCIKEPVQ